MATDPVELEHWRAVAAKPSDEAPRWEYLKWLKLKGNEERARFTQLQLDAAFCQPWDFLALEAANARIDPTGWTPFPFDRHQNWNVGNWERGFPAGVVTFDAGEFLSAAPNVVALAPITALNVSCGYFDVKFSRQGPRHREALRLGVLLEGVDPRSEDGERRISKRDWILDQRYEISAATVSKLKSWSVERAAEIAPIFRQAWQTQLRSVVLQGDESVVAALVGQLPSSITDIALDFDCARDLERACVLPAQSAALALAQSPLLAKLRSLTLATDGDRLSDAISSMPQMPELTSLRLENSVAPDDVSRLLRSTPVVRKLIVAGARVGAALASWAGLAKLEELVIIGASSEDVQLVMATRSVARLRSLSLLAMPNLEDSAAREILSATEGLQRLCIRGVQLSDEAVVAIAESKSLKHLLALELSMCAMSDAGAWALVKALYLPKLRWVRVGPMTMAVSPGAIQAVYNRFTEATPLTFEF